MSKPMSWHVTLFQTLTIAAYFTAGAVHGSPWSLVLILVGWLSLAHVTRISYQQGRKR